MMMMTQNDSDNDLQEPRIINIQPGGQAFETAGLRVGQVIRQVNDIQLKGWRHFNTKWRIWIDANHKSEALYRVFFGWLIDQHIAKSSSSKS